MLWDSKNLKLKNFYKNIFNKMTKKNKCSVKYVIIYLYKCLQKVRSSTTIPREGSTLQAIGSGSGFALTGSAEG